jgi:hypothetical protein
VVLPRLRQFKPDLIIISAGFDAHAKDSINGGFCGALEQDYEWLTHGLVSIANECCEGRIVSVLEGGYRIQGMCVSAFARSVLEHVRVLAESDPSITPDTQEMEWEMSEFEKQIKAAKELEVELRAAKHHYQSIHAGILAKASTESVADDEEEEEEEGAAIQQAQADEESNEDDDEIEEEDEDIPMATTTTTSSTTIPDDVVDSHQQAQERPKRRATKDINFVKLNEEMNREKESKRQKGSFDSAVDDAGM